MSDADPTRDDPGARLPKGAEWNGDTLIESDGTEYWLDADGDLVVHRSETVYLTTACVLAVLGARAGVPTVTEQTGDRGGSQGRGVGPAPGSGEPGPDEKGASVEGVGRDTTQTAEDPGGLQPDSRERPALTGPTAPTVEAREAMRAWTAENSKHYDMDGCPRDGGDSHMVDDAFLAGADHTEARHREEVGRIEAMARNLCRICGIDCEAAFLLADKLTVLTEEEVASAVKFFADEAAGEKGDADNGD